MKKIVSAAAAVAALALASTASAERDVFNNWHIHSGLTGGLHKPAAFFPAILGVSLDVYKASPELWAYCPNATDKGFLNDGIIDGSKIAAGICMNETTVIHLMTVNPDQTAPEGWARAPGTSTLWFKLTPR